MTAAPPDLLWQNLCALLAERKLLPPGHRTPAEIARHAERESGDTRLSRFVNDYYYPRLYGGGPARLSDADAEALVDQIAGKASGPAAPPVAAGGGGATVAGRRFASLRAAVEAAEPGQEVLIEAGIHREALVIGRPLALIGVGSPGSVILATKGETALFLGTSGILVRNLVIRLEAAPATGYLPAIDVSNGRSTFEDCEITNPLEGCDGVWSRPAAEPVFRRCVFTDCGRRALGVGKDGAAILQSCRLLRSGAAGVYAEGNVRLADCEIADNGGDGIELSGGSAVFENCRILRNGRCGIRAGQSARPLLRDCRVEDNKSAGGFASGGAHVTFEQCGFERNGVSGFDAVDAQVTATGTRFLGNGYHGFLLRGSGTATLEGCRIDDNASSGVHLEDSAGCTLKRTEMSNNKEYGLWVDIGAHCELELCSARGNQLRNIRGDSNPTT